MDPYLTELLLSKGYEVHGIIRRSSSFNTGRIDHLYNDPHDKDRKLFLHYVDLSDGTPRKLLNSMKLTRMGWKPTIRLEEGIRRTIREIT